MDRVEIYLQMLLKRSRRVMLLSLHFKNNFDLLFEFDSTALSNLQIMRQKGILRLHSDCRVRPSLDLDRMNKSYSIL